MFPTDYAMQPADLARAAEERGFDALFIPDHTHIPASRVSPWPLGAELPPDYFHNTDMFLSLAAAAAVTQKIRLGTGVCLVIERDPIVLAKQVASLDHISGGRVDFGVGGGWNAEEMADHGTKFGRRWRILRENILAMKEIWTKDEAEFHGEFVNFDKMWCYPKPVQKPHPPIFMGGDGPRTFDRVVEFCDGWMPIGGRSDSGTSLSEKIAMLRRQADEAGRDGSAIPITIFGVRPDPNVISRMEQDGVSRVLLTLPPSARDTAVPVLDQLAELMR